MSAATPTRRSWPEALDVGRRPNGDAMMRMVERKDRRRGEA